MRLGGSEGERLGNGGGRERRESRREKVEKRRGRLSTLVDSGDGISYWSVDYSLSPLDRSIPYHMSLPPGEALLLDT